MSDALRKHARRHHGVGLDPLDLASIAGTLTDSQHGTKTGIPDAHHRKWSWADEQGWNRHFILPHAFQRGWTKVGKMFGIGAAGEWDAGGVSHPCVIKIGDTYYIYHSGMDGGFWNGVGVYITTNPENPASYVDKGQIWTKPAGVDHAAIPSVIYDVYETDPSKVYKGWFWTYDGTYGHRLWHTYSDDPITGWATPIAVYKLLGIGCVCMKWGKLYVGVGPDGNNDLHIYISRAPDSGWVDLGVKLTRGGVGAWDEQMVRYAAIQYILGCYYVFYTGMDAVGTNWDGIGMASDASYAGLGSYNKFTGNKYNPILGLGAAGEWDADSVLAPSVLQVGKTFYMWYGGRSEAAWSASAIGLAKIP